MKEAIYLKRKCLFGGVLASFCESNIILNIFIYNYLNPILKKFQCGSNLVESLVEFDLRTDDGVV
jgi:hypothetical protein